MDTNLTNRDESQLTWTDALVRHYKDALVIIQAHPEASGVVRTARRALGEAIDLAKSDAPYLIYPDHVGPEAVTF